MMNDSLAENYVTRVDNKEGSVVRRILGVWPVQN